MAQTRCVNCGEWTDAVLCPDCDRSMPTLPDEVSREELLKVMQKVTTQFNRFPASRR